MSIKTCIFKLRDLLDEYFESKSILEFKEIREKYIEIIKNDLDLLLVFRETRYFDKDNSQDPLYFQYLSFGYSKLSGIKIFETRNELVNCIGEYKNSNFEMFSSSNCTLYLSKEKSSSSERKTLFNLSKRLLVFFYQNSGSKLHFLKSVSDRLIKEFWGDKSSEIDFNFEHAVEFISTQLDLNLVFYAINDEIVDSNTEILDCISLVHSSSNDALSLIESAINKNQILSQNIFKSILRKNQNIGKIDKLSYCISAFTDDQLLIAEDNEIKSFKIRPQYLCIYLSEIENLSTDAVYISNVFLRSFIRFFDDFEQNAFTESIERTCKKLEFELGVKPVAEKSKFDKKFQKILINMFQYSRALFDICPVCIRLYHPVSQTLNTIFDTISPDDKKHHNPVIPISCENTVATLAFRLDELVAIWSSRHLNTEQKKIMCFGKKITKEYEWQQRNSNKYSNFIGIKDCSMVAVPIRVNNIVIGVIEFSSASRTDLLIYTEIMENLAETCGNIYRRLELANDRGWLVRMHFLHAARHRIEQIIGEVEHVAEGAANDLRGIIQEAIIDDDKIDTSSILSSKNSCKLLKKKLRLSFKDIFSNSDIDQLINPILQLNSISRRNHILLCEIFEALSANIKKHGFQSDALTIFAGSRSGEDNVICVTYQPKEEYESRDKMERVCISPLINEVGSVKSYSYGLFLLATQIRMSGGWMVSHTVKEDFLGQVNFGFTVILNAEDLEE